MKVSSFVLHFIYEPNFCCNTSLCMTCWRHLVLGIIYSFVTNLFKSSYNVTWFLITFPIPEISSFSGISPCKKLWLIPIDFAYVDAFSFTFVYLGTFVFRPVANICCIIFQLYLFRVNKICWGINFSWLSFHLFDTDMANVLFRLSFKLVGVVMYVSCFDYVSILSLESVNGVVFRLLLSIRDLICPVLTGIHFVSLWLEKTFLKIDIEICGEISWMHMYTWMQWDLF